MPRYMHRKNHHHQTAPNCVSAVYDQWRREAVVRSVAALCLNPAGLPGTELSKFVGISPRGLRQTFAHEPRITAHKRLRRPGKGGGEETWYALDLTHVQVSAKAEG